MRICRLIYAKQGAVIVIFIVSSQGILSCLASLEHFLKDAYCIVEV